MYQKQGQNPISPENFELTFEGKLSSDNRWVVLASLIPWAEFEDEYSSEFSIEMGAPAKPFRVALGAKLSASCFDGYVFLDHISWDNFNESGDLKSQLQAFKKFTGYYRESVHVDKIYRTRDNRAWCKERGIIISSPPLGRPPKNVSKEKRNKHWNPREFVIVLRESLDRLKEDLA